MAETDVTCTVPGCGKAIRYVGGQWRDDHPTSPTLCPHSQNLVHRPDLRTRAVQAVVEELGLIWPAECEPMHEEVADAVLALVASGVYPPD